jgi:ATP-dependent phosphoenolpyruvate carboxykinase
MAKINLEKYGITGVTEIVHNPSYEVLFEELITDHDAAAKFTNAIIPQDVSKMIPESANA